MVKAAPKIVLRTRPSDQFPTDAFKIDQSSKTVTVTLGARNGLPGDKSGGPQQYQFKFDSLLHNAGQEAVFGACASDVVQGALEGYNGTILCYGQTGAGKTYTMTGDRSAYQQRGLIPRTVSALIAALRTEPGLASWQLRVSYLEIYNEAIFDLLDITTQPHEITLHEDGRGRLAVSGLRAADVRSEQEALALFFEGEANRVIGEHQLNRESSRSHCVFTLSLALEREAGGGGLEDRPSGSGIVSSKISLVDLAGSERVRKTRSEGLVLKEAGHINKSLHILEQVVLAASERGRDHVPYRSCKLTHVLRDSIGGNCRTVLVANVWGEAAQLEETLSTCRFAARMARIQCEVTRNVAQEGGARVKQLEREVAELLEELAMHDLWARSSSSSDPAAGTQAQGQAAAAAARAQYAPYTHAQRAALRVEVQQFLEAGCSGGTVDGGGGEGDEEAPPVGALGVGSMRRLRELLYACRALYREARNSAPAGSGSCFTLSGVPQGPLQWRGPVGSHGVSADGSVAHASASAHAQQMCQGALADEGEEGNEFIGDDDGGGASQSGGAGVAPEHARPGSNPASEQQHTSHADGWPAAGPGPGSDPSTWPQQGGPASSSRPSESSAADAAVAPSASGRAAALELYRRGPGAAKAQLLNDNHAKMRAAKRAARELALQLNGLKQEIDALKGDAAALRAARLERGGDEAQVATDPELQALAAIRDLKSQYRDAFGELQLARSEAEYTAGLADACRNELAAEFEAWLAAQPQQPAAAGPQGGGGPRLSGGGGRGGGLGPWPGPSGGAMLSPSRQSSAASCSSMLLGGLPNPSALASPAPRTPVDGSLPGSRQHHSQQGRGSGGGVPLASIVVAAAAAAEAQGDSAAAAYYHAQQAATWRVQGGGMLRPGSAKKHRSERGTFSMTQRGGALTDGGR